MRGVAVARRLRRTVPLVLLVGTGGCFATRNDVRVLQGDLTAMRAELLRNDAEQRDALQQANRLLQAASDSLARLSARTVGIQGDVRGEMRSVREQLLQIQQLLNQSQGTITRLRAELEGRGGATPVPPAGGPPVSVVPPTAGQDTAGAPGPTQLYQRALDLLRNNSTATARTLFQELLSTYPASEYAPDAQYYIAESLAKENNVAGADAAYAAVVAKYPDNALAPRSLYKRAMLFVKQGDTARARGLLNDVITRYPRSEEADLAAETLKTLR